MKIKKLVVLSIGLLALLGLSSSMSIHSESEFDILGQLAEIDNGILADHADANLTVPDLLEKYGYPVETHDKIVTEDGYILTAHRIPYSPKCGPARNKRVVWLQHGLLGDSSNWIVNGPDKGLAYNLADECYDVWMGNYRGNRYSRRHVQFDPDKNKKNFWSFSWNEIGYYDIPADIDYVMGVTGVDGIYYIGHSMGTTGFFVAMSERPEYNSKIKLMQALAPVAFTQHMKSPIALFSTIDGLIEWLTKMIGLYEFLPRTKFMEWLGQAMCKETSPIQDICNNVIFLIAGYNFDQLDRELVPTLMGHMPAGSSVMNIVHYSQGVTSGQFRKYDHGWIKNLILYGTLKPPSYDFTKITAPISFWWGENDWLAAKKDTLRLAPLIPNLQLNYRVNHDKWNHFDFVIAKDAVELLNKPVINFMKHY